MRNTDKDFENIQMSKEWKQQLAMNKKCYSVRKRTDRDYMVENNRSNK